jgi:hypothetical protein
MSASGREADMRTLPDGQIKKRFALSEAMSRPRVKNNLLPFFVKS